MEEQHKNRTERIHIRVTREEHEWILKQFRATTIRKLSEYARRQLLGRPIIATYRNQSLDDFMAEMIRLRSELNAIGNNFNQAVKKLHTLHQVPEFRSWIASWEADKNRLLLHTDAIKDKLNLFADLWLQ